MSSKVRIGVVGATGVVGREILSTLLEEGYTGDSLSVFASERSVGEEVEYADETLEIEKAEADGFQGLKLLFLATPKDASMHLAKVAQEEGVWAIDTSSAFREQAQVPLVLPGVNDSTLQAGIEGRVVSIPSATTTGLLLAVEPLRKAFGVRSIHYTAALPASHWGSRGVTALEMQTAALLGGREPEAEFVPHRMGFNVVPQVGPFSGSVSMEERAVVQEASRIWAGQKNVPDLFGMVTQAPIFYGTCISLSVQLVENTSLKAIRQALEGSSYVKLLDSPEEGIYPMPMLVTADPTVHVGRLQMTSNQWVHAFLSFDNVGFGAARQAVTLGQSLLKM